MEHTQEWEKEFDEKFPLTCCSTGKKCAAQERDKEAIKSFIRTQLAASTGGAYQRGAGDMKQRAIKGIGQKKYNHGKLHGSIDCEPCVYADLEDLITALSITNPIK